MGIIYGAMVIFLLIPGAETIIDVWLYSTQEMLEYEYKENIEIENKIETETVLPKLEPVEPEPEEQIDRQDDWLDFFSNTTEMDVDEMIIKPEKKIEERNDMENLIVTNIIHKEELEDNHANIISNQELEENHVDTKDIQESDLNNHIDKEATNCKEELPNELLTQPASMKKRIMKYMDPTTGKIYYLEMDRNLDLSKVQEIVINSQGKVKTAKISPIKPNGLKNVRKNIKKPGMSLLKPEVKSLLKSAENLNQKKSILRKTYTHIENDHCYLGTNWTKNVSFKTEIVLPDHVEVDSVANEKIVIKKEKSLYESLCSAVNRFTSMKVAVNYLLKKIPIICSDARDPDYLKHFPFVVDNEDRYWKLDFAKRRNIEVSKLIQRAVEVQRKM